MNIDNNKKKFHKPFIKNKNFKKFNKKRVFKKHYSAKKEEFKKYPWFLPDIEWKTFIKFYELFVTTKKNFHYFSFINTLDMVVLTCDVFYELPLNEHKQAHISANDELHVKRFGSSSRSHMALSNALFLGVINRVNRDVSKRSPNCLYYVNRRFYISLKNLYNIMSKWNEKLYQQFIEHYKSVHEKWLKEKNEKAKKNNDNKPKSFFKGLEISAEGVNIQGFVNKKIDNKPVDINFKIDWENTYKEDKVPEKDPREILQMLDSLMLNDTTNKDIELDKSLISYDE